MDETQEISRPHAGPPEPVLPMRDIQGIVVPGFFKPHQTLLGVAVSDTHPKRSSRFRKLTGALNISAPQPKPWKIGNFAPIKPKERGRTPGRRTLSSGGFTFAGLRKLTWRAVNLPGDAFRQGLAARSAFLGDPTEPRAEGNPKNWKVGGPKNDPDALLIIVSTTLAPPLTRVSALLKRLKSAESLRSFTGKTAMSAKTSQARALRL